MDQLKSGSTIPKVGQTAIVRNRPAIIREVLPFRNAEQETIHGVTVEFIDNFTSPSEGFFLWESELRAELLSSASLPDIISLQKFDHPDVYHSFINAYRWSSVNRISHLSGEEKADNLVSPWLSAVQIEDYQLYPVIKALNMPRITLLLADDVGLGKTIEAGLILNEMTSRGRLRRAMILCPASLQVQWRDEMMEKFSLDFEIVDRERTRELQREYGVDTNPWSFFSKVITSYDYLRQTDVLESFESTLASLAGNGAGTPWDMIVLDEAHNIAPKHLAEETDRLKMVKQIIPGFEHRLFLSATPHNGYTESFTGLLEVLNPLVFEQKLKLSGSDAVRIKDHVVRRMKSDFKADDLVKRFCDRKIERISDYKSLDRNEKSLFAALRDYKEKAIELTKDIDGPRKYIIKFLISLLTKRLLSSSYAFAATWWNHFAGLSESDVTEQEIDRLVDRASEDITDDEEKDTRQEEAVRKIGTWFSRNAHLMTEEIERINQILERMGLTVEFVSGPLSKQTGKLADSKWDALLEWVKSNLMLDGKLRQDERVIIFTEYKATLAYLKTRFELAGIKEPQLQTLVGGTSSKEREQLKMYFNDAGSPLSILLVTDVASEGVNLQENCRFVIHYEIPWNPMRLEQRNGRVDRFGQSRDVTIFHFVAEDEDDYKFLEKVVNKVEKIRGDLGSVSDVLDDAITGYFLGQDRDVLIAGPVIPETETETERPDADSDKGSIEDYKATLQQLLATEMKLNLNPRTVSTLLSTAITREGGSLVPDAETEGLFRFERVPPRWAKVVENSLALEGRNNGALPKLVFDSGFFRENRDGRLIYTSPNDTRLIRLAHPVMRKAVNHYRKALWSASGDTGEGLHRATVSAAELPAGLDVICNFHLLIDCYNELRERIHQEVIDRKYLLSQTTASGLHDDLAALVDKLPRHPLTQKEYDFIIPKIRGHWAVTGDHLREEMKKLSSHTKADFSEKLQTWKQDEITKTKMIYDQRLNELERKRDRDYIEKLRLELVAEKQTLQQPTLFRESEAERLKRLQEIDTDLIDLLNAKVDYLTKVIENERDKLLSSVIPKRYAIGYLEVQPLGVEIIVNKTVLG